MKNKGFTVLELLTGMTIFSILLSLSITGFSAIFNRIEIDRGIRQVMSCLSSARYLSIKNNSRIKMSIFKNRDLLLSQKKGSEWEVIKGGKLSKGLSLRLSTTPYFYPHGYIVPLFSIDIESKFYLYRISVSMAGRFKIKKLWKF